MQVVLYVAVFISSAVTVYMRLVSCVGYTFFRVLKMLFFCNFIFSSSPSLLLLLLSVGRSCIRYCRVCAVRMDIFGCVYELLVFSPHRIRRRPLFNFQLYV